MRDLRSAIWLAFLFVFGACATARSAPALAPSATHRPAILGEPGEEIAHLYARIIVRACTGLELEHLADQAEAFVGACVADGQPAGVCEESVCSKLRDSASSRCGNFASR
jgi:hypothetical protein